MALIVKPIVVPAALAGQSNGRLASSLLSSTPGLAGGPTVRLLTVAARAWRAMTAAAQGAGITLKTTSSADSYRTYDQQVTLFTSRYQTDPTLNGWRLWDSDGNGVAERWYKKDNVASAAVPGTSNHGWALAVDVANASGTRLGWLENHALAYGWSWELVPEEPWHLHYYTGDTIPAAVLDYETGDDMGAFVLNGFSGQPDSTQGAYHVADASPQGYHVAPREPGWNATCWPNAPKMSPGAPVPTKYTYEQVLAVLFGPSRPAGGGTPAGPVDVSDESLARIRTIVDEELDEQSLGGADVDQ